MAEQSQKLLSHRYTRRIIVIKPRRTGLEIDRVPVLEVLNLDSFNLVNYLSLGATSRFLIL